MPYNTLSYVNGPGYRNYTNEKRPNVTNDDFSSVTYQPPVAVPIGSETHGGDDVS
jgi:alkaline phosphatase